MSITGWFPGLITWIFSISGDPGLQNLRQNKHQGRVAARKLLDAKRQELKDGTARKDVMSLLGSLLPSFTPVRMFIEDPSPQSSLVILSAGTGD